MRPAATVQPSGEKATAVCPKESGVRRRTALGPITTGGGPVEAVRPFHKATTQRVAPLRSRPIAATARRAMAKGTPNRNVGKRSGPR
jgi:hypothetical protein